MKVDVVDIGNLYTGNKWQFSQGIGTFSSGQHRNLSDFLNSWQHLDDDVHISWLVVQFIFGLQAACHPRTKIN